MNKLNIYKINFKYIEYLKQFEKCIVESKNNRPCVGILVFSNNNFDYFAPLTSKINNTIPVPKKVIDMEIYIKKQKKFYNNYKYKNSIKFILILTNLKKNH